MGKLKKVVLTALQAGLRQGLGDSDKATQKDGLMVLQSVLIIVGR